MPIVSSPLEFNEPDLYVDLGAVLDIPLLLKCEGFNFAGSIKLKTAVEMVNAAREDGWLTPGATLVESSSGNLGVALSIIAADGGFHFACVTDVQCNPTSVRMMRALGAEVHVITEPHPEGGLLGARLQRVRDLCVSNGYVWLNQYTNSHNWNAHCRTTAPEIAKRFPDLDVLFVGAGTTGTLMGCARYFRNEHLPVKVVAVDAVGSVTFGTPAAPRLIPGLGTGVRPDILEEFYVDDVIHVSEAETVRTCHDLARHGFLFGGSTGSVVAGARRWLTENYPSTAKVAVSIAPDLGERYLDTIYDAEWLRRSYPGETWS